MNSNNIDLDDILEEIGAFGKYQRIFYAFIFIPMIIYSSLFTISYIFTSGNPLYRCEITECENELNPVYNPSWLPNAVPYTNDVPSRCKRFSVANFTKPPFPNICSIEYFNQTATENCDQFIFANTHTTIVNDFNLTCNENLWKLTLVGTINSVGQFICLPLAGWCSDRFGRRFLLIGSLVTSSILGTIRSFSPSYIFFLTFEFLDTAIGSGAYSAGYILGVELVGPSHRVMAGSLVSCSYAIGEAIFGIVALFVDSWRSVLRIVYAPGVLLVLYFWLTPESVRWLMAKDRNEEAELIIRKIAKVNGVALSEAASDALKGKMTNAEPESKTLSNNQKLQPKKSYPIFEIFTYPSIILRLVNCSFCWITCNFVYYGLNLNAEAIAGNLYINFILIALVEIPGIVCTYFILNKFGRRYSLCGSLILAGTSCIAFIFVSLGERWLRLFFFLLGKFAITVSFTVLYVFTSEMFPTPLRHSLFATCSMFGRTGSMIAPQTPLLALIWKSLPLVLFGVTSIASGIFSLAFPETLNTKLPNTLEEATNIGKEVSN